MSGSNICICVYASCDRENFAGTTGIALNSYWLFLSQNHSSKTMPIRRFGS